MYSSGTRLSDIIFKDFTVIPVLNRFGISLGVGDETIESAARHAGISVWFILDILNDTDSPIDTMTGFSLSAGEIERAVKYLEDANQWLSSTALPNIERHFRALHDRSTEKSNNLEFLWRFFQELKYELLSRIDRDSQILFPAVRKIICDGQEYLVEGIFEENSVEEKVDDLASFFVVHLRGDYDRNLSMAVVTSLIVLDREVKRSNRLRARLVNQLSYRSPH